MRIQGREATQKYLLSEVQRVYRSQGQNIHDKHFEVIINKMMARVQVTKPGDSKYLPGDLTDRLVLKRDNEELLQEGKIPAQYMEVLLGITKASLSTDSFLSASSFQHTIKVLAGAAISGAEDPLYGLKENVIIGKLIPAGTGYAQGPFAPKPDIEDLPVVEEETLSTEETESIEQEPVEDDLTTVESVEEEKDPTPAD